MKNQARQTDIRSLPRRQITVIFAGVLLAIFISTPGSGQVLSRLVGHYRIQGIIGNAVMAIGLVFSTVSLNLPVQPDFQQIIQALRESLVSAVDEVFLISFGVTVAALVISLFIKEIPLRKQPNL
jgi:hypothetical protein